MGWISYLGEGLRPAFDLVYPPRCPACGGALATQEGLCVACWGTLEFPADDAASSTAAVPVYAATSYNETSRRLVLAFKHGGRIALARLLARLMAARLPAPEPGRGLPLLVPVPLNRWRLWQRGYNQAALLAHELARLGKGEVLVDALERRKRTPSLGTLGRAQREAIMAGAITLKSAQAGKIAGRDIIIVDDVMTSGATTDACLAAMGTAGPASLAVACFARVTNAAQAAGEGIMAHTITPGAL